MGLLQENAAAQGVRDHYQFSGLPFIIPQLSSLDLFLQAIVDEFGDKLAHETALKSLQDCKMGNMKIGDFNSHFKSLATLVPDAPKSIRIDYHKKALSAPVRRQAILRSDWESAKMAIVILSAQQFDEVNGSSHSKPLLPASHNQMVVIPHNSDSMEVDVINLSTSNPSQFPRKFYISECKQQSICTRCLSPYNESHRSLSGAATCPNAAATLHAKVECLKSSKKNILPRKVSYPPSGPPQPVQRAVAAVSSQLPAPPHVPTPPSYPHPFSSPPSWGHPYPTHPPFHYGYPAYPIPPPPTILPPPAQAHPLPSSSREPHASVSAIFSEYSDLYSPVYYDLPGADYSQVNTPSPQVNELAPSHVSDATSVAAMTFTGSSTSDSRLVLSVMLLVGKRLISARALVDSGSGGTSSIPLSRRSTVCCFHPVNSRCSAWPSTAPPAHQVTSPTTGRDA